MKLKQLDFMLTIMNKIIFHSSRPYNKNTEEYLPVPSKTEIPNWFSKASKYWKNMDGSYIVDHLGERGLGFKSCPALLDSFSIGYLLKTPCDLAFYEKDGDIHVETPKGFEEFCARREEMPEFVVPHGYRKTHFHWWPNWSMETPEGYSLLVINPLNRFDLPFLTTNGIIDSDMYTISGLIPFFLKDNFVGLIPKGTPYAQVIPFKREDWKMEPIFHEKRTMIKKHVFTARKFRVKGGGIYKKDIWKPKKYE
jgi:hypothetical protein